MSRVSPLPLELEYLEPVRKHLAGLSPSEVSEDVDPRPFYSVLQTRIAGLSNTEAKVRLKADYAQLQRWLESSGLKEDRLYVLLGFLLVASESPQNLPETANEPKPQWAIRGEFPPEARVKRTGRGYRVRWNNFTIHLIPLDEAAFYEEIRGFNAPVTQYANLISNSVAPVQFGTVRGIRQIQIIAEVGSKTAKYALAIPGGHAMAAIISKGLEWDESQVERFFGTIQMTREN